MKTESNKAIIAVFGGGRWSRVLLGVLLKNTKPAISFTVHTKYFFEDMMSWVAANDFNDRVVISSGEPDLINLNYIAAIVANAADQHKKVAEMALLANVPVFVEKPLASSHQDTVYLIEMAKEKDTPLSPSFVFLNTSYIDNFIDHLGDIKDIQKINFNWVDQADELRYDEIKKYDSATPIFKDVLPHVLSILSKILECHKFEFISCNLKRGGSYLEILILASGVKCLLTLERNSSKRRREILVIGKKDVALDFSNEPGKISVNDSIFSADRYWNSSPSPLEKMLNIFLADIDSTISNHSYHQGLALSISKLIDQVEPAYTSSLGEWLLENLNKKRILKNDFRYLITELVRCNMKVSHSKSEEVIKKYLDIISGKDFKKNIKNSNAETKDDVIINLIASLQLR